MKSKIKWRRLNAVTHRDLGYFFSTLIMVYCFSGIALNHIEDWNPDFILNKKILMLPQNFSAGHIDEGEVKALSALVGEKDFKVYDFPTHDQVKIYFNNASLHVNLSTRQMVHEQVTRRPFFYQGNILHRNSLTGWKWASDVFAVLLIMINITGIFILRGRYGISGRGKWLIAAGTLPPLLAIFIQAWQT